MSKTKALLKFMTELDILQKEKTKEMSEISGIFLFCMPIFMLLFYNRYNATNGVLFWSYVSLMVFMLSILIYAFYNLIYYKKHRVNVSYTKIYDKWLVTNSWTLKGFTVIKDKVEDIYCLYVNKVNVGVKIDDKQYQKLNQLLDSEAIIAVNTQKAKFV